MTASRFILSLFLLFLVACSSSEENAPTPPPAYPDLGFDPDAAPDFETRDLTPPENDAEPECECRNGACCDGCNFLPETATCATDAQEEWSCEETNDPCGQKLLKRTGDQHCSGESAECNGEIVWKPSQVDDPCTPDQTCDAENRTCTASEACAQRCTGDESCAPDQFCNENQECTRDLCEANATFCDNNTRKQCDARGATSETLETCDEQCTPEACIACTPNFCQENNYASGLHCAEDGTLITCGQEGSCLVELETETCTDPTPLCHQGRCVDCLRDSDCPSPRQTCNNQMCTCAPTCSFGSVACDSYDSLSYCDRDQWGCERLVLEQCPTGQLCNNGQCNCASNFCENNSFTEGLHCDGSTLVLCGETRECGRILHAQSCPCSCTNGACDDCNDPNGGYIVLGHGEESFQTLEDGDTLRVAPGFQGGYHIFGAFTAHGISDPLFVSQRYIVTTNGNEVTSWGNTINMRTVDDHYEYFGGLVMFPLTTDPRSLNNLNVTILLIVRTTDNRVYTDTRNAILRYP